MILVSKVTEIFVAKFIKLNGCATLWCGPAQFGFMTMNIYTVHVVAFAQ